MELIPTRIEDLLIVSLEYLLIAKPFSVHVPKYKILEVFQWI